MRRTTEPHLLTHPNFRIRPATCIALTSVGMLAVGLGACGSRAAASTSTPVGAPNCAATAPKITVDASGSATAAPDTLTVSMGVQVNDPTATTALSDDNTQTTALIGSLKSSGVASGDVRSTDFSIFPTFTPAGRISGYQVSNSLVVTVHDLASAGGIIDTAASSVGNAIRVEGIAFSVDDPTSVDGRARAQAVTAADAHARSMAKAAGATLGGICSVSDTTTSPVPVSSDTLRAATSAAGVPVPLEPGTQQASAQVTVVYALGPR